MAIDLAAFIRRHKPEKRLTKLSRRPHADLAKATDLDAIPARKLLPDTNVYILQAAGDLPDRVSMLIENAALYHCSVCLGEIALGLANSDVTDPRWKRRRRFWEGFFASLPARRIRSPDEETWVAAGIVAGCLTRVQGYGKAQMKDGLNDALIYLTALKAGIPVLTGNHRDFDLLEQLVPGGTVFYL